MTVCDRAAQECTAHPGAHIIHVPFDDPPAMAKNVQTEEDALVLYRFIRDQIRAFVEAMPVVLNAKVAEQ